jgi:tRNA threonylcarbamoyladenosine biosynthesis protein TsaE
VEVRIASIEETEEFAAELAKKIKPGAVLCLTGDLGAGKTTLVKALLKALGVTEAVKSPTYTLVNEYHEPLLIYHFDLYRISNPWEILDIGFDDYLRPEAIVIIEWADRITELIPEEAAWIRLSYGRTEGSRVFELEEFK